MRGMMSFLVAVGLTIFGYLLMSRLQKRRESAGSDVSSSGPSYSSSGDGGNIRPWFSSDSSSSHSSGSSSDSGGDSGGGGDGGGD
jgi:hypothetical protein